jgi:hypothetical protein
MGRASNLRYSSNMSKKNYCAVIASHRRSNPYACRLLRHFIPRNDNLTEDLNLVYNKPLSASLLKRGRRDYGWIVRPFPLCGCPERTNELPYFILRFMPRYFVRLINQTATSLTLLKTQSLIKQKMSVKDAGKVLFMP